MFVCALLLLSGCSDPTNNATLQRSRQMPQWFDDAKLGIFIHWGPASVPGFAYGPALKPGELEDIMFGDSPRREMPYAEWYLNALNYPDTETARYHAEKYGTAPYDNFIPVFEQRVATDWNPDDWARLFANVGAQYVVLVTKHHDGYTLWPSAISNPHRAHWNSSRDLVGELAKAVRARGMRFGTYQEYADYVYAHMKELIDRYRPDVLWADIGYPSKGRKDELLAYYFEKVPEGTVNDRWGAVDVLGQLARIPGATTVMKWLGRQLVSNRAGAMRDDPGRYGFKTAEYDSFAVTPPFKWETTRGLGASFAYNRKETAADMLTGTQLVELLADTVAKNGNVLINVGPDSYGHIPKIQQAPLRALGEWMAVNGEAIYGTRPWQRFGNRHGRELRYTAGDNALYAIVQGGVDEAFTIEDPGVPWDSIEVLGAEVTDVTRGDRGLTISLVAPIKGPAVVVRYTLPGAGPDQS